MDLMIRFGQVIVTVSLLSGCMNAKTGAIIDPVELVDRAQAELLDRQFAEAELSFTEFIEASRARKHEPGWAAYGSRAIARYELGRSSEALEDISQSITLAKQGICPDEDLGDLHYMRGKILDALGNQDAAKNEFAKARKLSSANFSRDDPARGTD